MPDPAARPAPHGAPAGAPTHYWLHALLFVATCATTYFAQGLEFAATLMTILLTHEMGHYVAGRIHRVEVSLPYFIPVPFSTGTLGAIIRMRAPITRRNALIDVGASGPLAGLCVAVPLLVWGLVRSEVKPLSTADGPAFIEGNSLLYIGLKLLTKGQYLPAGGVDVHLEPMAMAAWVGLLVTFINLIPIGQLDGGHVAVAFFGDRHEKTARWLHRGLLAVGFVVLGWLWLEAHRAGRTPLDSLAYAAQGAVPWIVWALLLLGMRRLSGGMYHPPVEPEPLTRSRRILFWVVAALFLLLFTPVPMREAL
jgi:membrane-associated protease RseP (regulator of RpoE activity)